MSTFDDSNPENTGNRERPEPGDPEAQFYQNRDNADARQHQQHHTGYGFGYPPGMDPDGFAHRPGWHGQPGWQPWAGGGGYYHRRHRHFTFLWFLLAIIVIALLFKPLLHAAFGLVGLGFTLLLILLPFIILGVILRALFWRHWGHRGWRRGGPWGGPWGW